MVGVKPEEVIGSEGSVRRPPMSTADAVQQRSVNVGPQPGQSSHKLRCLAWAGQYASDWEILAYYQEGSWEACFFKWGFHHEHTNGSSFEEVQSKAEQRIDFIERGPWWAVLPLPFPERVSDSPRVLVLPEISRRPELRNNGRNRGPNRGPFAGHNVERSRSGVWSKS